MFLQSLSSLHLKIILSALERLCENTGSLFSHTEELLLLYHFSALLVTLQTFAKMLSFSESC